MEAPLEYKREADEELRIDINERDEESIEVELTQGTAEIFGYELRNDRKLTIGNGAKFSIFTFQGCTLKIYGALSTSPVIGKENPMMLYLQVHAGLEKMREQANKSTNSKPESESGELARGPVTMVVGPTDSGTYLFNVS